MNLINRKQAGVTLIELIVAMVIIAIALVSTLGVISRQIAHSADPMLQHQAVAIAKAYMDEILLKEFADPDDGAICPTAEASRDLYDNVCDYNGLDHSGARSALADAGNPKGPLIAGLGQYRVRVTVDNSAAASLNGLTGGTEILRVDVRVTHLSESDSVDYRLSSYRTANVP